jgi:hypothetical protein
MSYRGYYNNNNIRKKIMSKKEIEYYIYLPSGTKYYSTTTESGLSKSLSLRRLIQGVGKNDADYPISVKIEGKQVIDFVYDTWREMVRRAYNKKFQERHPTYKDVSVCDYWLIFSNFKSWFLKQNWIDKDLVLMDSKKVYAPHTCRFVSNSSRGSIFRKGRKDK